MAYNAPLKDMQFLLNEVFTAESMFSAMPATNEVTEDLMTAILEEAGKIAGKLLSPINQTGDKEGCSYRDGLVITPKGFREAYKDYIEGGWPGLTGEPNYGGQGMPKVISALIEEMFFSANTSFCLYTVLTTGAALTINECASENLKKIYLPKMYQGIWSGTMCLTESHAGTDLGMINTKAAPNEKDSYHISGTKIFITAGEHDLSENIVHLVLAKLPDAPAGPRGISLFLVPKILVNEDGSLGARNKVVCGSIENKMGIKASATCVLHFQEATGFLIGESNNGLSNLFTMMNYERLSMGLQGNGLAESSYQLAAEYASERLQGRAAKGPQLVDKEADPILVHPDVRRMLLTMKANIIAGRALSLYSSFHLDISRLHPDEHVRERSKKLVSLLVPVQKAYCSDRGFEACVLGQQVLGGHGYVAEWGLEQNVRDARIAQIYEGANGIQALDLMDRKTVRTGGEQFNLLMEEMEEFLASQKGNVDMKPYLEKFLEVKLLLVQMTKLVIEKASDDPDEVGAASYSYMELMGLTLYCFMWQRIILSAIESKNRLTDNQVYYDGLIKNGRFFLDKLLPKSLSLVEEIKAGADSLMSVTADQF